MKLIFRIETNKIKQPRIVVLRTSTENKKLKKLGSFNSKQDYQHITQQLNPEELYEFENFVKTIEFSNTQFGKEADELDRFIIKVAPELKKALFDIWEKAKDFNLSFIPEHEMLLSLFNKAKITEQFLALISNNGFKALSNLKVDINDLNPPQKNARENLKILQASIKNNITIEQLAKHFNQIANEKYKKQIKIEPNYFEYMQGQLEGKEKSSFPKWYLTILLDLLYELQVNLEDIASPALITEHWLILNKKETIDLTLQAFIQQFPTLQTNPLYENTIRSTFFQDEILKIQKNSFETPIPSTAISNWYRVWKKKNPHKSNQDALNEFYHEFPLLAGNPWPATIIQKL